MAAAKSGSLRIGRWEGYLWFVFFLGGHKKNNM